MKAQVTEQELNEQTIGKITEALLEKHRSLSIVASGIINLEIAAKLILSFFENRGSYRILYLCDQNLYLEKAEKTFTSMLDMEHMVFNKWYDQNNENESDRKTIFFSSYRHLLNDSLWKRKFVSEPIDLVIIDRAHTAAATKHQEIVNFFLERYVPIAALTTSPDAPNNKELVKLLGKPVQNISLEKLTLMGAAKNIDYILISDYLDKEKLNEVVSSESDFNYRKFSLDDLHNHVFIEKRDEEIAQRIADITQDQKKVLIFCGSVQHVNILQGHLNDLDCGLAYPYHSDLSRGSQKETFSAFKNGSAKYLLVVGMLNDLMDLGEIDVIFLMKNTPSKTVFYEKLSIGLMHSNDENPPTIIDFDNSYTKLMEEIGKKERYAHPLNQQPGENMGNFVSQRTGGLVSRISNASRAGESTMLRIDGSSFNWIFDKEVLTLNKVSKDLMVGYYPNFQEWKEVASQLGCNSKEEYAEVYSEYPRLHRRPDKYYPDFTNWHDGLETPLGPFYRLDKIEQTEEVKKVLKEICDINSQDDLIAYGAGRFSKCDFGIFGNGVSFVRHVLLKDGIQDLDTEVLLAISKRISWQKKVQIIS